MTATDGSADGDHEGDTGQTQGSGARLRHALRWRRTPAATRWSWGADVIVAGLHSLAAITLLRLAAGDAGGFWDAVPGGRALLIVVTLLAATASLWGLIGSLARATARRDENAPAPFARAYGLMPVAMISAAASTDDGRAPSPVFDMLWLGLFGALFVFGGVLAIGAARTGRIPVVDGEARPVRAPGARRMLRAGRLAVGVVTAALGAACLVDAVRAPTTGEASISHAIDAVAALPGGAIVLGLGAALLVVCAASALVRAGTTAAAAGQPRNDAPARPAAAGAGQPD